MVRLFWFAIFTIMYIYMGYPAFLKILSYTRRRRRIKREFFPSVTLIIAVQFLDNLSGVLLTSYKKNVRRQVIMGHARAMEKGIFADVIEKIEMLTVSQQKFLQEMLASREKVSTVSRKKLLKKSFGVWADRKDIKGSIEYVDNIREGWGSRLERIKG